ncbi:MAG: tetratricopeptide repeat protein [Planctomycetaceae bacterium]|nr:tetratricopeptide repeat protein [Planctomycetaceae bacterium]
MGSRLVDGSRTVLDSRSLAIGLALVFAMAWASPAVALDTIRTSTGAMAGRVTGMSATSVQLAQGTAGTTKYVPVNQIQVIHYEGEPRDLRSAKAQMAEGKYVEALAALQKIKEEPTRPEIQEDVAFYKALAASRLALAGNGKISDAGRMMKAFVDANPKSYHYFEASEVVGDLLVAIRQYGAAADYYGRLEKAPWPDFKMRAAVATGRALLEQGKTTEAETAFDKVLATQGAGEAARRQRVAANVGKAAVLVAVKKPDDAVKLVEEILKQTDTEANPEESPLVARAYNVEGAAHRQAGQVKEAILAFLRVDLLYSGVPDAHAEALANLVELWGQVHKNERANRARQTLQERYPDSPWAKKAAK